jgi:hypothetical protein
MKLREMLMVKLVAEIEGLEKQLADLTKERGKTADP